MAGIKRWQDKNALFEAEGGSMNIGLGKGKALEIFNEIIIDYEIVPR